jgi:hypothetical protein
MLSTKKIEFEVDSQIQDFLKEGEIDLLALELGLSFEQFIVNINTILRRIPELEEKLWSRNNLKFIRKEKYQDK